MASPGVYSVTVPGVSTPVTVHIDDFEGSEGSFTYKGYEFDRGFMVEGLEGSGVAIVPRAIIAVQQVPITPAIYIGSYAPGNTDLRIDRIGGRPAAVGVFKGTIHYAERYGGGAGSFGNNVISLNASITEYVTNQDVDGNPIYAYPGTNKKLSVTTTRFAPTITAEIDLTEYDNPVVKAKLYVGAVNAGSCPWDPTAQPRCWMCVSVPSDSHDRGLSWHKKYTFQYRMPKRLQNPYIGGWDQEIIAIDPSTGNPVKGYVNASGVTDAPDVAITQPSEDFNALNFLI